MLKDLSDFLAINQLPFHPHMTLGKLINPNDRQIKEFVKERLSKIKWKFKIKKIAIYGADTTKSPEYQEKIADILI